MDHSVYADDVSLWNYGKWGTASEKNTEQGIVLNKSL